MQFQSKHILFWLLQFKEIHHHDVCYMQFDAPAISFGHFTGGIIEDFIIHVMLSSCS